MPYLGNYRDRLLNDLMHYMRYPRGESEMIDGVETPIDPMHLTQGDIRGARAQASMNEDVALRYGLGKQKRDAQPGEVPGMYSMVDYAGGPSPWMVSRGVERGFRYNMPGQIMDNREKMAFRDRGRAWYEQQMKNWGRRVY
jgi:hypothetical protein